MSVMKYDPEEIEKTLEDTSLLSMVNAVEQPEAKNTETYVERKAEADETRSLVEWAKEIGGPDALLTIHRYFPERFSGVQTAGHVATLRELPEGVFEDFVKDNYGGGKYEVKVQKRNTKGVLRVVSRRRFEVEGDPRVAKEQTVSAHVPVGASVGDTAVTTAMDVLKDMAMNGQSRAPGIDPEMLSAMTEPLKVQVETLLRQLEAKDNIILEKDKLIADKDRQLSEMAQRKPETGGTDALMARMLERGDNNITMLQTTFASEKSMMLQSFNDEKKRLEDRAERERRDAMEIARREVDTVRMMYENQIKIVESGWQSRMEAKESRISDLKREIDRAQAEVDELRRRKDKSLIEVIGEAQKVQEVLGGLGGGKEEEDGGIMSQLGPLVQGIAARISQPAPPPPPQLPPQRMVRRRPPQDTVAQPPPPPPQAKVPAASLGITDSDVATAVQAMEAALVEGQAPDAFVSMARPFVPPSVIVAIKQVGIDKILDDVADLQPESPLQTQAGRVFARRAALMMVS